MAESKEARNNALVLKALDTLFNNRDYAAAERLWSPNYIQPSAHIEPGREGLIEATEGEREMGGPSRFSSDMFRNRKVGTWKQKSVTNCAFEQQEKSCQ
jgi:hypothetical protein